MRQILVLVVILLTFLPSDAQSQQIREFTLADTALAKHYADKIASGFTRAARFDSAIFYFKKAREVYKGIAIQLNLKKAWEKYIVTSYALCGNYWRNNDFKNAIAVCEEAINIAKREFGENHPLVLRGHNNLGIVHRHRGDYFKALQCYQKILQCDTSAAPGNKVYMSHAFGNMANISSDLGDYEKALEYDKESERIWISINGELNDDGALGYNNMGGSLFQLGRFDEALANFERALGIWVRLFGYEHYRISFVKSNIGDAYREMKKFDQAIASNNEALLIAQKLFGENHPQVATAYHRLGNVYQDQLDFNRALEYYNKALTIRLDNEHEVSASDTYQKMGEIHLQQHDFQAALEKFQKSLSLLIPSFNAIDIFANPSIVTLSKIPKHNLLTPALAKKAEAFQNAARFEKNQLQRIKYLRASMETYELTMNIIEMIQSGFKADDSKLYLSETSGNIYENAIEVALQLYSDGNDKKFLEKVFSITARYKAAVLAKAIIETEAKQYANIPDTLIQKERDLRIDLIYYRIELQKTLQEKQPDSLKIGRLESMCFSLSRQNDALSEYFEKKYPKYYDLKYRNSLPTVVGLQNAMDAKTALLEYFLGESALYIFTVTQRAFNLTVLPVDSSLHRRINTYFASFKSLSGRAKEAYCASAFELYQKLIQPVEKYIANKPNWIIIPHNELCQIPFEALLRRAPSPQDDDTKLDYLIKHHEISYHYSTALFLKQRQAQQKNLLASKSRQPASRRSVQSAFVGFAPVFNDGVKNGRVTQREAEIFGAAYRDAETFRETVEGLELQALPFSELELQAIVKMFAGKGVGYFHQEAGEEKFRAEAGKYQIVHVSTHGRYNAKYPNLSGLIFSQPATATLADDGVLYAAEIYNLALNADLLVLSSCKSAAGSLQKGEGLMALTRAFIYAGANNIVASLWNVLDRHTSGLMISFYEQILQGKRYAEALRAAKLKMIAHPQTADPKAWAGFILIGR